MLAALGQPLICLGKDLAGSSHRLWSLRHLSKKEIPSPGGGQKQHEGRKPAGKEARRRVSFCDEAVIYANPNMSDMGSRSFVCPFNGRKGPSQEENAPIEKLKNFFHISGNKGTMSSRQC